jgi:hypothetical protein
MRTLPPGGLRWRFLPLLANTEASQRILVMKQKTAAEHFRRALKRIADFGWIRITSPGSQNEDASADGWVGQLSVVRVW